MKKTINHAIAQVTTLALLAMPKLTFADVIVDEPEPDPSEFMPSIIIILIACLACIFTLYRSRRKERASESEKQEPTTEH